MTLYPKLILDALATVRYPGTGKNLVEAEMVADNMRIDGMKVSFSLTFEKPTDPFMKSMVKAAETAIHTYVSPEVEVVITTESRQAARPEVGKLLPQVKNVIGVSSGKGGVGKSSVSVNLASALAFSKFKVCLIDGDFGLKNLDVMMGLENRVVYDLNDVVEGRCTIEQVLVKDKRIDGLSLLPSCKSLSFENLDTEIMNSLIERLNKDYDFIIVDSPAGVEKGFQYSASLANEAEY